MGIFFSKKYETDPQKAANGVYDYIIVGGGTAGCVLASRLSENPNVTVLVVEAGARSDDQLFSKIPIAFNKLFKTQADWNYSTVHQPGLHDRELYWPRGKLLGGSSSMNAMIYQHCSPSDFDEWETKGAKGWNYKALYPYFLKSEKFTPHVLCPDVKLDERGQTGFYRISYSYLMPVCQKFIEAAQQVGLKYNPDINTPRGSLGVARLITSIDTNGRRNSAATAYLSQEVLARKNLTVLVDTTTTRIVFSSHLRPRAIGVEVTKTASSPRVHIAARREVIVSAGAVNTPQLLNLSGIGAKDELEKLRIDVVKDLPAVGKNMTDHLGAGAVILRAVKGTSLDYMTSPIKSLPALIQWYFRGKGPATSNVAEVAAFLRSVDQSLPLKSPDASAKAEFPEDEVIDNSSGPESPDLELLSAPMAYLSHGFRTAPPGTECFGTMPILLRPLSTGRIYLATSSPFDKPIIDANYLSHPNDVKILTRGIRLVLRIARTAAFRSILQLKSDSTDMSDVFFPGDADPERISDEHIQEWIKENAETIYHPMGTARMGASGDDKGSVVDPELKVHGVEGLRVVDASVFPAAVSGHPAAVVVALAEKASEMISKS